MSHDNPLIPPREILEIPNSQLPVLLVPAVQANSLKTCHTLIRGGAVSTPVTLSSGEEPCRLTSRSHPGEEPCRLMSRSHPGRSRVDSRHALIRGGAVLTHVTLSSGEELCRLTSRSHPGRSPVDSRHTLVQGGPSGNCIHTYLYILARNVHVHVVSFNCY